MSPLARIAAIPVIIWRYGVSGVMPMACRYEPSCSAYALEALRRHGALRGSGLALRRLARCHPWGGFGYDPVPDAQPPARTCRDLPSCRH